MSKVNGTDVCFYEAFEEEAEMLRKKLPDHVRAVFTRETIQEAGHTAPPASLVSIRTQSVIPPSWATGLGGILTRSTGFDHVARYRSDTGIGVAAGYLPLYCNRAVAEQAMMLWMGLLRKLPMQLRRFGRFARDGLTGSECAGKTLLVVGVGNIGHQLVRIGRGLDMRVLGVDLCRRHADVDYVTVDEGLPQADVIVCAMNLTEHNHHYFDRGRLNLVRRGAVFVNIARGEFSPARHLLDALRAGRLAGVALDVYECEPTLARQLRSGVASHSDEVAAVLDLLGEPNVLLTPHNAFNTRESVERKAAQSVEQVIRFLEGRGFIWPVP